MAKIILLHEDELDGSIDNPYIDEVIEISKANTYVDMLRWLIDNDINFHSDVIEEQAVIIMKDEEAAMFKLRWSE